MYFMALHRRCNLSIGRQHPGVIKQDIDLVFLHKKRLRRRLDGNKVGYVQMEKY